MGSEESLVGNNANLGESTDILNIPR